MTNSNSSSSAQPRTYYTLLGIDQDANPKEIEKAYKRQALIHHPDRNPNDSQSQSTNMFQKLAEAYEVLRDPIKRRKYDLKVANAIALHSDPATAHSRPSPGNAFPNRPASQQSSRPTNQPKRSSTFDLFAYPGEVPRYVPSPSRRPASTAPAFRPRSGSSAQSAEPMTSASINPNPSQLHRHCSIPAASSAGRHHHQQSPAQHKPFTQKINLKDLDSLDFLGLHPQSQNSRPSNIPSPALRAQARPTPEAANSSFHPTHSRDISSSAPDPYLTFERAWGQSLDGIVDGIADRQPDHRRYPNRKSNTEPISLNTSKPPSVHRSATVRSADSDYRSSSSSFEHSTRRPRSAGGNRHADWLPSPNCTTSPQRLSSRSVQEPRSSLDDDLLYLPSSAYSSQNRRMSTGNNESFYHQPTTHHAHQQPRLYRHASNTGVTGSSIRGTHGVGVRGASTHSQTSSPTSSSTDCPASSHPMAPNSRRSRASTLMPDYPPLENKHDPQTQTQTQSHGLSREFREVIIRFERERDGSTRLSKEIKSRTIDLDGTVHDRYRRQRAAAVN
ncbi:hypothetical protein PGT21_019840 [Puccinia graminis f. sp. tritici]|uniref:J domain-containing protein n=1 Tax=Puccinia graminis f. sp. tritici TaxID=56615 RepID=A0A5B0P8B6_PUCGR|nr:hypothetical protein PGT21_019840 [Puccinia graminis f. sp. tritici]KAA1125984.1 hypothetical protein PGTUg99_005228 [Puccinia graminis f. sp. tritici]